MKLSSECVEDGA